MENEMILDLLRVFVKHKKLPKTVLRNEEIIMLYKEMRRSGTKGTVAKKKLADRFFTSVKNIDTILYEGRGYGN